MTSTLIQMGSSWMWIGMTRVPWASISNFSLLMPWGTLVGLLDVSDPPATATRAVADIIETTIGGDEVPFVTTK